MTAMRVRFVETYIYTPTRERRVSIKFKPGLEPRLVNEECGLAAIAAGAAERVAEAAPAPRKRRRRAA